MKKIDFKKGCYIKNPSTGRFEKFTGNRPIKGLEYFKPQTIKQILHSKDIENGCMVLYRGIQYNIDIFGDHVYLYSDELDEEIRLSNVQDIMDIQLKTIGPKKYKEILINLGIKVNDTIFRIKEATPTSSQYFYDGSFNIIGKAYITNDIEYGINGSFEDPSNIEILGSYLEYKNQARKSGLKTNDFVKIVNNNLPIDGIFDNPPDKRRKYKITFIDNCMYCLYDNSRYYHRIPYYKLRKI